MNMTHDMHTVDHDMISIGTLEVRAPEQYTKDTYGAVAAASAGGHVEGGGSSDGDV